MPMSQPSAKLYRGRVADQIVEDLQKRREEYGFSYVVFSGDQHERMAPVVKKLAGT